MLGPISIRCKQSICSWHLYRYLIHCCNVNEFSYQETLCESSHPYPTCFSRHPDFDPDSASETEIQWRRSLHYSLGEEPVPVDNDRFPVTPTFNLYIRDPSEDDTGKYMCLWKQQLEVTYLLEVVKHMDIVQVRY